MMGICWHYWLPVLLIVHFPLLQVPSRPDSIQSAGIFIYLIFCKCKVIAWLNLCELLMLKHHLLPLDFHVDTMWNLCSRTKSFMEGPRSGGNDHPTWALYFYRFNGRNCFYVVLYSGSLHQLNMYLWFWHLTAHNWRPYMLINHSE